MENETQTVRTVADALGRKAIADRVGVKPGSVTEAIRAGLFPASWYMELTALAREEGVCVLDSLFRWARPSAAEVAE